GTVALRCLCVIFFFQAEDGIRDGHVTGVQTCALPIWEGHPAAMPCNRRKRTAPDISKALRDEQEEDGEGGGREGAAEEHRVAERSEERRVGKECRARGPREAASIKWTLRHDSSRVARA